MLDQSGSGPFVFGGALCRRTRRASGRVPESLPGRRRRAARGRRLGEPRTGSFTVQVVRARRPRTACSSPSSPCGVPTRRGFATPPATLFSGTGEGMHRRLRHAAIASHSAWPRHRGGGICSPSSPLNTCRSPMPTWSLRRPANSSRVRLPRTDPDENGPEQHRHESPSVIGGRRLRQYRRSRR